MRSAPLSTCGEGAAGGEKLIAPRFQEPGLKCDA